MIFILDNLNAIIIFGGIVLMLLVLRLQTTEIGIEQTSNYMMKKQAMDLATWLEDDLLSVGKNMDGDSVRFGNPTDQNYTGLGLVTREFTFYRHEVDTAAAAVEPVRIRTRYLLDESGTRNVDGIEVPVFRLRREIKRGDAAATIDGQSSAAISYFSIRLQNRDGMRVANGTLYPDSVSATRVRFSLFTDPFGNDSNRRAIRRTYYGSTLLLPRGN